MAPKYQVDIASDKLGEYWRFNNAESLSRNTVHLPKIFYGLFNLFFSTTTTFNLPILNSDSKGICP